MRRFEVRWARRWLAALSIATLGALAAASAAVVPATAATKAGSPTITVGAEEFPSTLNNMLIDGNSQWTGMIAGPVLARGYRLLPDFTYEPWIFSKDCTVTTVSPFTVGCAIRPDAVWSDGVPITADDFKFTYDTIMNPDNNVWSRNGYDKISAFNVTSPTEFQMQFKEPFAPYRDLWASTSTTVLPKHILEGQNFNKVWTRCICDPKTKKPIGSGPMLVGDFESDRQVTLVPNKSYWGEQASVSVVFIPIPDSNSQINAFRAGEVDMIYPQNQIGLRKRIEAVDDARYETTLGPSWEHLDLNTTVPGLDDVAVRKAIATALPRQQIVDRVVKDANDNATVLNNGIWMTNQKQYEPNWSIYPARGDLQGAAAILDAAGWKPGDDGVREKDGVRLSFRLGTTTGNQARILAEQIVQEQLRQIGIEMKIKNGPIQNILGIDMVSGDFDSLIFAWSGSPDPFGNNVIWLSSAIPPDCPRRLARKYQCEEGGLNYTHTNDPKVDELLKATEREPDPVKRAALYNEADLQLAQNNVTVIPLFQKPTQLGYRSAISGVQDNPTQDGFTWNIENWALSR